MQKAKQQLKLFMIYTNIVKNIESLKDTLKDKK